MIAFAMDEVTELTPRAPDWPMEVPAGHRPIIAGLDKHIGLSGCLLLCNRGAHDCLRLLLLRAKLSRVHRCERLLAPQLILSFDMRDRVLDHLKELLVRHGRVVAQKIHDLLTLTYKKCKRKCFF